VKRVIGAEVLLTSVMPPQTVGVGSHALIKGLFGAITSVHRHADLSTTFITQNDVALDGQEDFLGLWSILRIDAGVIPLGRSPGGPSSC
jgi:hypothetical protein